MRHTKTCFASLTILVILLTGSNCFADHILGGELLYQHLSGNRYKIILNLYGECSGGSFPHLKNAAPRVNILNTTGAYITMQLKEDITQRKDISNVCEAYADKTTCKSPTGTIPGVTKFVYRGEAILAPSPEWQIIFAGHMDNTNKSQTGLSTFISNVKNNSGFGVHLYLKATLNNQHAHNSSPVYTTDPNPYYCVNIPQEYNVGAVDAEMDELQYTFARPYDLNGINTEYISPYSPTYPFSSVNSTINYDSYTGQMSFTPTKTEVSLVITECKEYRDGVLIGTTTRAVTFFILQNCNNQAPEGNIDPNTVQGGLVHNNTINLCDTTTHLEFKVPAKDNNNDNILITLSNVPNGANAHISDNGSTNPVINFEWDILNATPGIYTMYATYTDGACPIPGKQVIAYTINIAKPISIFHEVLEPTNCKHKQFIRFHISGGLLPRKVKITNDTHSEIVSYENNSSQLDDSFAIGNYTALVYSENLPCNAIYNFEVTDYGTYPEPPLINDIHHCLYEEPVALKAQPANGGKAQWYDIQGLPLDKTPVYNTDSVQTNKWIVNQKVKVCESVFDTVEVSVHPYPNTQATTEGGHACIGDGLFLEATGGVRYDWQPAEKITYYDDTPFAYIYNPETFIVTGYSEYDCSSIDTLVFDDIEQCCLFSYPNAFTPNNDGINDGWHPVTYGNVTYYLLSVYNRWGERVFTSTNPKEKWNGMYHGQPCKTDTYHYLLKAKCVTGHEETSGGNFTLLR